MTSSIVQNIMSGLPVLIAMAALLVGGAALIASARRTRDEVLVRRVALVEPAGASLAELRTERRRQAEEIVRLETGGVGEASQREIIRLMSRFGLGPRRALTVFAALRIGITAFLAVGVFIWSIQFKALSAHTLLPLVFAAMAAIIGWFVPAIFLSYDTKQRTKSVRAGLPDALELLVICVEAGLSLEDGLGRVVTELGRSQPALAYELELTLADLRILPSRDQALANLATRVDVPSVRAVVTTLAQTLRYGTPLVQALRVTAAELRNDYLIEMEEKANRLPAYLTLPVILFLMPTIFLIVGGPAALRLIDAFMHR